MDTPRLLYTWYTRKVLLLCVRVNCAPRPTRGMTVRAIGLCTCRARKSRRFIPPRDYPDDGIPGTLYEVQGASLRGRPTPPATLPQKGKVHQIMRRGQRSMTEYLV